MPRRPRFRASGDAGPFASPFRCRSRTWGVLIAGAAVVLALVAPGSVDAISTAPPAPVVGSGTINVPLLTVRSAPRNSARIVARLSEFRPQDYRQRYVLAVNAIQGRNGKVAWYKITVPGRPNGRTGWVRAPHVTIRTVPWQVVVFRGSRVVQVWKGKKLVNTARVAVGAPGTETPTGLYFVTVRFKPVQTPFLGSFAFETSAYSKLSEWPGGGVVGLHGTTAPQLLGQAVSHGCVRLSNQTADFLRDRIPLGTPIRILAS